MIVFRHKTDSILSFLKVRQIGYRHFFNTWEIQYRRFLKVRKHRYHGLIIDFSRAQ